MSLNNWLCKHFDDDKKGYVTLKDAVLYGLKYIFIALIGFIIIYPQYRFFSAGGFDGEVPEFWSYEAWGGAIFMLILIIIGFVTLIFLYEVAKYSLKYILNIKIAKCPLKEDTKK